MGDANASCRASERPSRLLQFGVACGLSLLFMACYGLTNYLASQRGELPTLMFDWEPLLPLIPAFIVPYMLIDALFFAAPFLCTTRRELATHARRTVFVTLVAALVFYIYPLELAIQRPRVDGVFGPVFDFLQWFDQPHNLFPSLHVAYVLLLRVLYGRHTRGSVWWAFHVWFTLTSLSVVFVRQHHVPDFVGGALLAMIAFYFVPTPERAEAMPPIGSVTPRLDIFWRCLAGAAVLTGLTLAFATAYQWEWVILLWPAASLALISTAYVRQGPRVFQKCDGRISLPARVILLPYLLGLGVSRWWYRRRIPMGAEIDDRIVIGRAVTDEEARQLIAEQHISAVLDLTAEHDEAAPLRALEYRNVPIADLTVPTVQHVLRSGAILSELTENHRVFVHCALGYSRSVLVVAAYLVMNRRAETLDEAIEMIRKKRGPVVVSDEAREQIRQLVDQR